MVMFVSINAGEKIRFNLQMRVISTGNNHQLDKINVGVIKF